MLGYQQAFVHFYPQIPVHNLISNTRALLFLWISPNQLNIMVIVLSH